MMNESGDDEERSVVSKLMENGLSEAAAVDVYQYFRKMRETTSLFESAQRATEIELEFFALQGEMADVEARLRGEIQTLTASYNESSSKHTAMLESAEQLSKHRKEAVRVMLENLPYHTTKEQREALIRMETTQDFDTVMALFESVSKSSVTSLPIGRHEPVPAALATSNYGYYDDPGCLDIVPRGGSVRLANKK